MEELVASDPIVEEVVEATVDDEAIVLDDTVETIIELSEFEGLTAASVGLGNVDNTSDALKPVSVDQANAIALAESTAKSYADGLVVGLLDDRGSYDASSNVFPSSGGSGTAGAIKKGDLWLVSVAGTLGGVTVNISDLVRALVDAPAQTASNWGIVEGNLGYTPENVTNKVTSLSGASTDTQYPSAKLVYDQLAGKLGTGGTAATATAALGIKTATTTVDVQTATAPTIGQVLTALSGTAADWQTPAGGGSSTLTISNKTGAYTVVAGDLGTIINCTSGTFTVSLTAAATLGSGFNCWVWNTSTTAADVITIDPNGSETIDGKTTRVLRCGEGFQVVCDGTNLQLGDKKAMRGYAENASATSLYPPVASGFVSTAIGGVSTASATYSFAAGLNSGGTSSQAVTGAGAMALGGSYASGTDSFAVAIANNTSTYGATGANSVAIGASAKASGQGGAALTEFSLASGAPP